MDRLGGKAELTDPRFRIRHAGEADYSLVTRSSDGQLLFLANKLAKMMQDTPLGSRIAEVHNGSSLFTGDAGSGESNIRRWVIESDWLEAIIALPLNIFYNTGIATYIWVVTNRKPEHRRGRVQLIDAGGWSRPLRKNLGRKNCELSADDIARIIETHNAFADGEHSKVFPNRAFGYWKLRIERPLRLKSRFSKAAVEGLRYASGDEDLRRELFGRYGDDLYERLDSIRADIDAWLRGDPEDGAEADGDGSAGPGIPERRRRKLLDAKTWRRDRELLRTARQLRERIGDDLFDDHNLFRARIDDALNALGLKPSAADKKAILGALSWRDETAPPVIRKIHKPDKAKLDPLHGFYAVPIDGKTRIVEYEPDPELRDSEQVPMVEETSPGAWTAGDVKTFFEREVQPHAPDAWIDGAATKVGYEISFTRWFYKPKPLRTLAEIRADIEAEQRRTAGLLDEILIDVADGQAESE